MVLALGAAFIGCSGDGSESGPGSGQPDAGGDAALDGGGDASTEAGGAAGAGGSGGTSGFDGPEKLSATGLYVDIATRKVAADVIPFEVRFETWVDGLTSDRYLWLPPGTTIDTSTMDYWKFPVGTKAWKDFSKDGKLLETRYLEKRADGPGGWLEIAYAWDDAGTDALPVPVGVPNALGTQHDIPSQDGCTQCHDGSPEALLGVSAIQLSRETGTGPISELASKGLLSNPPGVEFAVPGDAFVEQSLGYLHANCAHCHNDTHFLATIRFVRYNLRTGDLTPEETPTYKTNLVASEMNHVVDGSMYSIVAGKPLESQTYVRMAKRDVDSMPPLDTEEVDAVGMTSIFQWISGLP